MVKLWDANPALANVLEFCPCGVVLTDTSLSMNWANKSAIACLTPGNLQLEPLLGQKFDNYITPLNSSDANTLLFKHFFTSPSSTCPPIMALLNQKTYVEVVMIKLECANDMCCCCYITEIGLENAMLRERESAIINNSLDAVVQSDVDCNIIGWNKLAEKIFGWTEEEIIGKPLKTIIPERLRSKHESSIAAYFESEAHVKNKRLELSGLKKNGGEIPVELCVSALTFANGVRFFSAFIRDLSQEKVHKSIAAANEAKSVFMSSVSHELRSPLNAIFGFAQLLGEMRLTPDQRDYVQSITTASEGLIQMVSDMADLSKIEAQKIELDIGPFDLASCVSEVVSSYFTQAKNKHVEFASFVAPCCPLHVLGDARRLRQILVNLMTNAIKFTEKGSIIVEVKEVQEQDGVAELLFQVHDTGIGIESEDTSKLFKRFSQLGPGIANKAGSGLGLSICAEFARLMGGTIGVNSEGKGKGTTFWFTCKMEVGPCGRRVQVVPSTPQHCAVLIAYGELSVGKRLAQLLQNAYNLTSAPIMCANMTDLLHAIGEHNTHYSNFNMERAPLILFVDESTPGYSPSLLHATSAKCNQFQSAFLVLIKTPCLKSQNHYLKHPFQHKPTNSPLPSASPLPPVPAVIANPFQYKSSNSLLPSASASASASPLPPIPTAVDLVPDLLPPNLPTHPADLLPTLPLLPHHLFVPRVNSTPNVNNVDSLVQSVDSVNNGNNHTFSRGKRGSIDIISNYDNNQPHYNNNNHQLHHFSKLHNSDNGVQSTHRKLSIPRRILKRTASVPDSILDCTIINKPINESKLKCAMSFCGIIKNDTKRSSKYNNTDSNNHNNNNNNNSSNSSNNSNRAHLEVSRCMLGISNEVENPNRPVNAKVLIAEDNPLNYKIAEKMLHTVGYECKQAINGIEALKCLAESSYNLVLMDCQMPLLDGYETTKKIREMEGGKQHVPIVAMTANAMHGDREQCLSSGMDDYVSKPFQKQKLIDTVDKWVTSQTYSTS